MRGKPREFPRKGKPNRFLGMHEHLDAAGWGHCMAFLEFSDNRAAE